MTPPPLANLQPLEQLYRDRWRRHGVSPQSLGWTKGKQHIRFDVLLSGLDCEGKSFLDVGCGFGDLNAALQRRARRYRYLGVDMMPEFVAQGRELYGREGIEFQTGDFQTSAVEGSHDIVIGSGLFAFLLDGMDNYQYINAMLRRMFASCTEAVAVDLLSDRVNFKREGVFYANAGRVLEIAFALTRNVRLRHDYMPFEFALTLFKDDSFLEDDTVFNRHKHEPANR